MVEPAGVAPHDAEYVNDVPYPRNFVPQLAPATMRLVAALGGHAPPPGDGFDYCELGAGRGDTLVTLAASNPLARFVGVDLGAEHTAFARDLAARGGVGNVRVIQQDFEDGALAADLPDFDFIGAHGVLSWISPAKRAALFRFARAKLKPGGLLLASYNALPGWAAIAPLRRLMLDHAASVPGSTLDRARAAYDLACRLSTAKAGYFASHPTAQTMLDLMKEGGLPYMVHEYFHAHWHPMYFADVAGEAAAHDLSFAGQTPLYLNVPELALPPAVKEISGSGEDRVAFETLKDFAANELFRSDVYVRGPARPDPAETRAFFEGTAFGALTTQEHVKRQVRLPVYTLDFTSRVYAALLPRLCAAPATAVELARRPELAGLGSARIAQCLQNLCLGGQIVPMRPLPAPSSPAGRPRLAPAFNRRVLDQGIAGEGPLSLASPATGTGLSISLLEAIFLRLLTEVEPEGRAAWIRSFAETRAFPIVSGTRRIEDAEELVRIAPREVDELRVRMGPKLCQLGILEMSA
jgi:SAM-dependent methyltransferase